MSVAKFWHCSSFERERNANEELETRKNLQIQTKELYLCFIVYIPSFCCWDRLYI